MPIQPGTRIGGYEVTALIGAGGMGEVYRARDLRLDRNVAIKIVAPQIGGDAAAAVRFEREARALAALNHPNIAAIYGVEDLDAQPALILELVEGETLADRLARGPLPIAEALAYARQIADALDVAHEAGIVHRDLKPANIKVTEDGRVKVLDFGLAKAMAAAAGETANPDLSNSPTVAGYGTRQGVIMGTAAYMSPEQARGKRIDKRTDLWAFGCVLVEMLGARRAFDGETTSDIIAAIIERAPNLSALPQTTPPHIRRVVERCLEKDPKRRFRDIGDVRFELDAAPESTPASVQRRGALLLTLIAVALTAITVAAIMAWRSRPTPAAAVAPIEFTIGAPSGYSLAAAPPTLSPDGQFVAFVASDEKGVPAIFLRTLDSAAVRRLEGTDGVLNAPTWSPDSRALAFLAGNAWRRLDINGGPAITMLPNVVANLGASWSRDNVLLVAPANRTFLSRLPVSGGSAQQVTTLDTQIENSHRWPHWLPDGRHYLFTVRSDRPERLGIKLGELDSTESRLLINVASPGIYTEPGWLLFITPDQVLMAQRFDPATLALQGTPQPVAGPVRYNGPSFSGLFHASLDGKVLTYIPPARSEATLEWFDRAGKPLGRLGPERPYRGIRLSPDGRKVAVELAEEYVGTRDIWLIDTTTQALTRFTSHTATDWRAVFSPDGSEIAFASDRAGASSVLRSATNGSGTETSFYRRSGVGTFPSDWSRDGNQMLVSVDDGGGRPTEAIIVPVNGGQPTMLVANDLGGIVFPRFSPSGDRLAFVSIGTGNNEVFVMSVRDRQRVRISTDGGNSPIWGADGRELFFLTARNEIMRAVVDGTTLSGSPQLLFRPCEAINRRAAVEVPYDVSADGTRFLVTCEPPDAVPTAMTVVVNWQSKLH